MSNRVINAIKNIYYNNDKRLRKAEVKIEMSPEQIREVVKCSNDIEYFLKTYVKIVSLEEGLVDFKLYDYQLRLMKVMQEENRVINLSPRQSGKSISTCGFLLHYIIFNEWKNVAILANKEKTARKILAKIKLMYRNLPLWLQRGIDEWNKNSITLDNGCYVEASATSSSGIRGDACSILYIDETAFIDKNLWDEFYASSYPTISSSKKSKIILSSTPRGMNHFYKLWTDAENKRTDFKPFRVDWREVPYMNEEYKKKIIAEFGEEKWLQEYECEFLGSAGTLISGYSLKSLVHFDPIELKQDENFLIYEYPIKSHKYVAISDVSEGLGLDASTVQVIDVTELPYKQVAKYENNTVKTFELPDVIYIIAKLYNEALVIVEANSIGDGVLNDLNYDLDCENLFFHDDKFGIKMTKGSKRIGNSFLKQFIEDGLLQINDFDTISQMSKYIKKGTSYEAEDGENDDLITPLVLFSYFMRNKDWVENWLDRDADEKQDDIDRLEEELLPIGFINDGDEVLNMGEDDGYISY